MEKILRETFAYWLLVLKKRNLCEISILLLFRILLENCEISIWKTTFNLHRNNNSLEISELDWGCKKIHSKYFISIDIALSKHFLQFTFRYVRNYANT